MKKKLEAELISIAHRVLKLKNRSETIKLQEEAKKLYEQLTILRFYEENIEVVEKEIAASNFEEKLAVYTSNESPLTATTIDEIVPEVKEESMDEVQEVISEETLLGEKIGVQEEALQEQEQEQVQVQEETVLVAEETEEEVIEEVLEKEATQPQQISFEDVFGADFKEPEFVKVEDVPAEVEQAAELSFEAVEETEEVEKPVFETKTVVEEVMIERTETIQATKITTFHEEPKTMSLNDRLNKGINIGLNDRIAFEKRLFGGSPDDFNRVLSQLNTFDTFEEAKGFIEDFVKPDYDNWNGKEEYEARFLEIVEKKFN